MHQRKSVKTMMKPQKLQKMHENPTTVAVNHPQYCSVATLLIGIYDLKHRFTLE